MQSRLVPEKCIACGLCQVYAPNIFDYDDHGIVLLKTSRMLDNNLFRKRTRECVKSVPQMSHACNRNKQK